MVLDLLAEIQQYVQNYSQYNVIRDFLQRELLIINLLLLAVGFVVLLIEIRLPLKYYWNLPMFGIKRFLVNFHILQDAPVWGTVSEEETGKRIPLAVVELIDRKSLRVVKTTFTSRLGEFGFNVTPGEYFVRAIKNYYSMPSFLDPENIELEATDESFATPVLVHEGAPPIIHMTLIRLKTTDQKHVLHSLGHYTKTFFIALSNGSLLLSVVVSYIAWVIGLSPLYGILIVVGILLLFIKIYILETVGIVSHRNE